MIVTLFLITAPAAVGAGCVGWLLGKDQGFNEGFLAGWDEHRQIKDLSAAVGFDGRPQRGPDGRYVKRERAQ